MEVLHITLVVDEPHQISSIGIEMNVEFDTNDFARNYYYYEGANENGQES